MKQIYSRFFKPPNIFAIILQLNECELTFYMRSLGNSGEFCFHQKKALELKSSQNSIRVPIIDNQSLMKGLMRIEFQTVNAVPGFNQIKPEKAQIKPEKYQNLRF